MPNSSNYDSKKAYAEDLKRKRFARNLRTIRKSLDMSEEELAEKAGYKNSSHIVAIENSSSDPSYEKVKDIANALGVSISQLKGVGMKIETNEEGWPKLTESERTALNLFAPILDVLSDFEQEHIIKTALLVCKANNVVPNWKKPAYLKNGSNNISDKQNKKTGV